MATRPVTVPSHRLKPRTQRLFFSGMAAAMAAIIFVGFGQTYYLKWFFETPPLPPLLHLHGALFTLWPVLLVLQTALVASRRIDFHRRVGIAGAIIAALMILVGSVTAVARAKAIALPPGATSPLAFLTIPLGDMLVFAILVGTGLFVRRQADTHKRLMLLATISILPAATARLPLAFIQEGGPLAFFGLADLLIGFCLLYDWAERGRVHRATLWGGLGIVLSQPLRLILGHTGAWLTFATWLTQWTE